MKFTNAIVLRVALREYTVSRTIDMKFKLNESHKISSIYKNKYGRQIYASKIRDELIFHIKIFHQTCVCRRTFFNFQVKYCYMVKKYLDEFKTNTK